MIYNYTKCESIIAKIMADLDSSEVNNRITDIREWIFEAVDKIGAPMQYIRKESGHDGLPLLVIKDNQVPLPADLIVLDGVAYSESPKGPWVPMTITTSIFREPNRKPHKHDVLRTSMHHDPANKAIEDQEIVIHEHQLMNRKLMTSQSQLYTVNGMKYLEKALRSDKPEYFVKPGWLVINKNKGFVKLSYKSIAVDERGYPLIPDLTSYQEAVYWYVVMKLSFPKFMSGKLSGNGSKYGAKYAQQTYFYIQQQWNFYRNQAYAEAMMPTADDMENIKNDWNKLVPEWDARDTFFKDINKQQSVYTDYYYGY